MRREGRDRPENLEQATNTLRRHQMGTSALAQENACG